MVIRSYPQLFQLTKVRSSLIKHQSVSNVKYQIKRPYAAYRHQISSLISHIARHHSIFHISSFPQNSHSAIIVVVDKTPKRISSSISVPSLLIKHRSTPNVKYQTKCPTPRIVTRYLTQNSTTPEKTCHPTSRHFPRTPIPQ